MKTISNSLVTFYFKGALWGAWGPWSSTGHSWAWVCRQLVKGDLAGDGDGDGESNELSQESLLIRILCGDQIRFCWCWLKIAILYHWWKKDPWQFLFQIKRVYDIIPSNSGVSVALILKNLNNRTYKHTYKIFKDERVSVQRYIQIIKDVSVRSYSIIVTGKCQLIIYMEAQCPISPIYKYSNI